MKQYPIIQLLVILLGVIFIYNGAAYLLTNVYMAVFSLINSSGEYGWETTVFYIVAALSSLTIGYVAIIKSKDLSGWIGERSKLGDGLKVISNSKELLSIFILFLALQHLLTYLPGFASHLFSFITNSFPHRTDSLTAIDPNANYDWLESFLHLLFSCLMIIFCGNLTNYFYKNLSPNNEFIITEEAAEIFPVVSADEQHIEEALDEQMPEK